MNRSPRLHLREHAQIVNAISGLVDFAILLGAGLLAYYLKFSHLALPTHYLASIYLAVLYAAILFPYYNLYRGWRGFTRIQELRANAWAWLTVFFCLILTAAVFGVSNQYSRQWFGTWLLLGLTAQLSFRFAMRSFLRRMRARGFNLRSVVILGSNGVGRHTYRQLKNDPELGFKLLGYYSIQDEKQDKNIPTAGDIDAGIDFIRQHRVDQVWIAMPFRRATEIERTIKALDQCMSDIRLVPDIFGYRLLNHSMNSVGGLPVINISVTPMDGVNRWVKSFQDKLLALLILLLASPVMLLIAAGVKLSSPGPVFYRQERVGWNGYHFTMLKFRSMPVDAEARTGAVWARAGEQRATRFGAFLRRTSLDELPQFINVLRGDMSIVGPRPERPVFVEQFKDEIPGYMQKHRVKAGITGWAQVHGWRGNTDLKKRIEYDLEYIENWSLWLDLKIIFLTLFRGFFNKNAY